MEKIDKEEDSTWWSGQFPPIAVQVPGCIGYLVMGNKPSRTLWCQVATNALLLSLRFRLLRSGFSRLPHLACKQLQVTRWLYFGSLAGVPRFSWRMVSCPPAGWIGLAHTAGRAMPCKGPWGSGLGTGGPLLPAHSIGPSITRLVQVKSAMKQTPFPLMERAVKWCWKVPRSREEWRTVVAIFAISYDDSCRREWLKLAGYVGNLGQEEKLDNWKKIQVIQHLIKWRLICWKWCHVSPAVKVSL